MDGASLYRTKGGESADDRREDGAMQDVQRKWAFARPKIIELPKIMKEQCSDVR